MKADQNSHDLVWRVRSAVVWRSGSQIAAQLIMWASTFIVIRLLDPSDYGLFAMSRVILVFFNLMNGHGFANALIQRESVDRKQIAQAFGVLIALNGALALVQFLSAPLAAAYFRQPIVADLLRVQALLYLITPFIAVPNAILSREMNFQRQAVVNLFAAAAAAATALIGASSGWGVWALVAAPLVLFYTRGVGLTLAARSFIWPSFRLAGSGGMLRFGLAQLVTQLFWFIQSQSDVFIGGRFFSIHELGIYTTALFLTQVLVGKFVPPLNEVAFAAYSRIQTERDAVAGGFLKTVQIIMLISAPFYLGLAVTAEPLVLTVMGPKWAATIPIIELLALAMPFMTLQILYAPATNALGRPGLATRVAVLGALIMPLSFLAGAPFGIRGLAYAWLIGFPILTLVTSMVSLPVIGVKPLELVRALIPVIIAAGTMALAVLAFEPLVDRLHHFARLGALIAIGVGVYGALLGILARSLLVDLWKLVRRRELPMGA